MQVFLNKTILRAGKESSRNDSKLHFLKSKGKPQKKSNFKSFPKRADVSDMICTYVPGELQGLGDNVDNPKDIAQAKYDPHYDPNLSGQMLALVSANQKPSKFGDLVNHKLCCIIQSYPNPPHQC